MREGGERDGERKSFVERKKTRKIKKLFVENCESDCSFVCKKGKLLFYFFDIAKKSKRNNGGEATRGETSREKKTKKGGWMIKRKTHFFLFFL